MSSCIRHAAHRFFILHDDFLELGRQFCAHQAHAFATCLRVLETWTNDQFKILGEDAPTEEDLWLEITWAGFGARALWLFSERSFRAILPRVVEAGLAQERYIRRGSGGEIVAIYPTYAQAQADRQHQGDIRHQVLLLSDRINALIAGEWEPEHKNEGAQRGDQASSLATAEQPSVGTLSARGGNPVDEMSSSETIPSPWQNCQGEAGESLPLSYCPPPAGKSARPPLAKVPVIRIVIRILKKDYQKDSLIAPRALLNSSYRILILLRRSRRQLFSSLPICCFLRFQRTMQARRRVSGRSRGSMMQP